MHKITIRLAAAALTASAAFGLTAPTADAAMHKAPTRHEYTTDLGSSWQWRHATKTERRHAERAYLAEYGSWQNGCKADLRHAYRGTTTKTRAKTVRGVHVDVLVVKGPNVKLAEYVDGVCPTGTAS